MAHHKRFCEGRYLNMSDIYFKRHISDADISNLILKCGEPLYDLETFNKLIMQGLICGLFYLALFLYFLRETIKIFKQK